VPTRRVVNIIQIGFDYFVGKKNEMALNFDIPCDYI
jgi:hypothetical protein